MDDKNVIKKFIVTSNKNTANILRANGFEEFNQNNDKLFFFININNKLDFSNLNDISYTNVLFV